MSRDRSRCWRRRRGGATATRLPAVRVSRTLQPTPPLLEDSIFRPRRGASLPSRAVCQGSQVAVSRLHVVATELRQPIGRSRGVRGRGATGSRLGAGRRSQQPYRTVGQLQNPGSLGKVAEQPLRTAATTPDPHFVGTLIYLARPSCLPRRQASPRRSSRRRGRALGATAQSSTGSPIHKPGRRSAPRPPAQANPDLEARLQRRSSRLSLVLRTAAERDAPYPGRVRCTRSSKIVPRLVQTTARTPVAASPRRTRARRVP